MAENTNNIVNLFVPCQMDMFQPGTANSVKTVLNNIGVICQYDKDQTCCGYRFYIQGEMESATDLSSRLVDQLGAKLPVVVPDCSCAGFMKTYYRKLLTNSHSDTMRAEFVQQVYELCDFIVYVKHIEKLNNYFPHNVYYFKSCAARNLYPESDAPEILLRNTLGLSLIEVDKQPLCCGANGRFPLENPKVSEEMTGEIVRMAYDRGAEYITSTDIHCLQKMEAYKNEHGVGIEVMHIADILNGEHQH